MYSNFYGDKSKNFSMVGVNETIAHQQEKFYWQLYKEKAADSFMNTRNDICDKLLMAMEDNTKKFVS